MSVHRAGATAEAQGPRRGRAILAGALGLAVVGGLSVAYRSFSGASPDEPRPAVSSTESVPSIERPPLTAGGLSGRLVYTTALPGGLERLWVLDLATGTVERGPEIPQASEILSAGPEGSWLLILEEDRHGTTSYLLRDLAPDAEPVRVARGSTVSLSRDGDELFVADVDDRPGCGNRAQVRVVVLESGSETAISEEDLPCGTISGVAIYGAGTTVVGSIRRRWPPAGYILGPAGPDPVFPVALYVWSSGRYVFASSRNDLVVWPGGGTPHPLLSGARAVGRPIASTRDGRYLALGGAVDGQAGIWVIDVASGTVLLGADSLPPRSRVFDATFARDGTLYLVGWDGIAAAQPLGLYVVPRPSGAPEPRGQVVWLP